MSSMNDNRITDAKQLFLMVVEHKKGNARFIHNGHRQSLEPAGFTKLRTSVSKERTFKKPVCLYITP